MIGGERLGLRAAPAGDVSAGPSNGQEVAVAKYGEAALARELAAVERDLAGRAVEREPVRRAVLNARRDAERVEPERVQACERGAAQLAARERSRTAARWA